MKRVGIVRARVFFAAELSSGARREAAAVLRELSALPGGDGVRWVRPENFHVTLRFLGDVDRDRLGELAQAVSRRVAPVPAFSTALGRVMGLPSRKPARVLVLELAPSDGLVQLAQAVEAGVVSAGFAPELRPFRAHLTLGRVKRSAPDPGRVRALAASGERFDVAEVVLFESELRPQGAIYRAVERIALNSHPHPRFHSLEEQPHGS